MGGGLGQRRVRGLQQMVVLGLLVLALEVEGGGGGGAAVGEGEGVVGRGDLGGRGRFEFAGFGLGLGLGRAGVPGFALPGLDAVLLHGLRAVHLRTEIVWHCVLGFTAGERQGAGKGGGGDERGEK